MRIMVEKNLSQTNIGSKGWACNISTAFRNIPVQLWINLVGGNDFFMFYFILVFIPFFFLLDSVRFLMSIVLGS